MNPTAIVWQKKTGRERCEDIGLTNRVCYNTANSGRRGDLMPMYEFTCKNCKKTFTLTISLAEYEKAKFTCPKCKGKKVEQRFAPFFAVTSKKS